MQVRVLKLCHFINIICRPGKNLVPFPCMQSRFRCGGTLVAVGGSKLDGTLAAVGGSEFEGT